MENPHIHTRTSKSWDLDNIHISHSVIDYREEGILRAKNDSEYVRLHFGLKGSYDFTFKQLNNSFSLSGQHNNIMYSQGLDLEVQNKSNRIESFGINIDPDFFIGIGQNGNDPLKRFTEQVLLKKDCILSANWKPNNFKIQQVIQEILNCTYQEELKKLFLLSKSIELLVLQAELYALPSSDPYIKLEQDKQKLFEAKELLTYRMDHPPTIVELSKLIGINEYKLKKGFKELFGTTIFGYVHSLRMNQAQYLLRETDKSAKEIAYEIGYSSPQHFSHAFKRKFGVSPKFARNNPPHTIE